MTETPAQNWICITCGTQFPASATPPEHCPICEDERQYVGWNGQQWKSPFELREGHKNTFTVEEPGLTSIHTRPDFAIGQRAFVVRTPDGNLLWDCIALVDEATIEEIRALGGLRGIAISHPHYYTAMVDWSKAFGGVPIYLHRADRQWVQRLEGNIQFWSGASKVLFGGLTLIHCAGHFDGFQVLHWPAGAEGRGALLPGDQPQVCMDRRWVTFLYSYPNMVPLGAPAVRRIMQSLEPLRFDRIYGPFGRYVMADAKAAVRRSAERYLRHIGAELAQRSAEDPQLLSE